MTGNKGSTVESRFESNTRPKARRTRRRINELRAQQLPIPALQRTAYGRLWTYTLDLTTAAHVLLMNTISAFRLRDRYFIHPNKRTTAGLEIAQPDFQCLALDATPESIGHAILAALAQSQGVIPHPTIWSGLAKPRLAAAGVRSERDFIAGTRLVAIKRCECLSFEPTRNGGSSGDGRGFSPMLGEHFSLPIDASPLAIGEAFLKAIEECAVEM